MHIPDGFVSMPINAATFAASAAVCGIALARAEKTLGERRIPLLGVTAAFVFAAQMINFPVAAGTSGHFMGATLAAVLLGPLNAVLVLALVLTIQCLLFADGGLTALGTNVFNMGIVGSLAGYGALRLMQGVLPKRRGCFLASAAVASWASMVFAAGVCALELGLSGTYPLAAALPAMTSVHALIGVGEGLITSVTLSLVLTARPDLLGAWTPRPDAVPQEA